MTFAWFVASATTGKYQWREGVNVLFFIEAILFFWSLLRIRKFIKAINSRNELKPNDRLMNINLLTIAFEWLFFFGNFVMAFSKDAPPPDKNYTNEQCVKIIIFDVSYWMHWVAHIASTAVTCYMNLQFS